MKIGIFSKPYSDCKPQNAHWIFKNTALARQRLYPIVEQNTKSIEGIRHAGVELTAKGFRLGMLSPEHGDMNNWNIALFNNQ